MFLMFTPRKCITPPKAPCTNLQKLTQGDACAVWQLMAAMEILDWGLEETANFLDVSKHTVWRWTNGLSAIPAGKLKAIVIEAGAPSMHGIPQAVAL